MTRINMLPELQFSEDFKQLRRDIEDIKQAQRIGHDIMKPKIIECLDVNGNPTQYDIATTPTESGWASRAEFTAIFEADGQDEPWATPFFELFYGNTTTPAEPGKVAGNSYLSFSETGKGKIAYKGSVITNEFEDTTTVYVKVYFYATDNGKLMVVPEYRE